MHHYQLGVVSQENKTGNFVALVGVWDVVAQEFLQLLVFEDLEATVLSWATTAFILNFLDDVVRYILGIQVERLQEALPSEVFTAQSEAEVVLVVFEVVHAVNAEFLDCLVEDQGDELEGSHVQDDHVFFGL